MADVSERFLRRVWSAQPKQGYSFLSYFDAGREWQDVPLTPKDSPTLPNDGLDVYFAPNLFTSPKRRKPLTLPGIWLYADLDEVDPSTLRDLRPTIAWATSRGRYQALWQLQRPLAPPKLARLNQLTTYYTGADKGGWGLTKVLRVPGSVSTKHGYNFGVKMLWDDGTVYAAKDVLHIVRSAASKAPPSSESSTPLPKLPKITPSRILRRRRPSAKARKLYKATTPRGDRSARLWELECLLLKAGCTPEETLIVVRKTVWNKYAGQDREVSQLWTEINKAAATLPKAPRAKSKRRGSKSRRPTWRDGPRSSRQSTRSSKKSKTSETKSPPLKKTKIKSNSNRIEITNIEYNSFLAQRLKKPGWLVESVWSENAHGVLAGEPKTYKSVIATDLAISVASGTPFLNSFKIPMVGPVLIIQEENDPGEFQDRLRRIAFSRGLLGAASLRNGSLRIEPDTELPITLVNNQGFDLTDKTHLAWLRRKCRSLKPALIILDPFYLMTPGVDENSAAQVGPVLSRLLKLKQNYGVGIQLIHHYRKQNLASPIYGAARMSGTGVFHRWFESAVYVERDPKVDYTVRLLPDHRGHAPQGAIRCAFDLGTDSDLHYDVTISRAKSDKAELHARLKKLLAQDKEWQLEKLRVKMGLNSSKPLKEMITQHGYTLERRPTGGQGRPPIYVVQE